MSRLLLSVLLCAPLMAPAQAPTPAAPSTAPVPGAPPSMPTLTGDQTANIMKQLELLETQITKGRTEILGTALSKFRAAMASPKDALSLYLDCYKLEHYDRRDLKTTDFQAWKENNEDRLKDEEFLTGIMLQLEWLVLTIQAQDITEQKDMGPIVSQIQTFLPKAVAAVQNTMKHTASGAVEQKGNGPGGGRPGGPGGGRGPGGPRGGGLGGGGALGGTLRQSVKTTEFSNAFLLENYLKRVEWAYAPLDIADIYQQVIFPYYLETKSSEIPTQWDNRINAELALRKITMSETEYGVFFKERQPELAWQKATYMLSHRINPLLAMADMLKIVRENPAHPKAADWLMELKRAVNEAQPVQAPTVNPNLPPPPGS